MIHLMLQIAAVSCLSCRPDAMSPPVQRTAVLEVQAPQPVGGCARISVRVDLNTSAVTVQDGTTCGQLVPERDTQPVFDASRRALRLPIVLRNATSGFVTAPVRVSFTADSIYRYRDGQQVPGSGSTRALNGDSASENGRIASWSYDTLLAAAGETQRIAPGERSRRFWLEFTGPELWLRPGGADADTTLSLRLDANGFYQIVADVPAVAPEAIPSWVGDDTSLVSDPRAPTLRFTKNVVTVTFKPGTTQLERAAAINRVAGIVIGGRRYNNDDGVYVVQLPSDPTNDRVFDALRVLRSDNAVAIAYLYWFMSGAATYLRPNDGAAGWTRTSWRVDRDSGYLRPVHETWALEASNAPRAWGCSVGDSLTRVAIIDQGIRAAGFADLVPNVDTVFDGNQPGELFLHGTNVAHVLTARGDNGAQMSGMLWRSRVTLYDASQRDTTTGLLRFPPGTNPNPVPLLEGQKFVDALIAAANRGARVINISLGNGDSTFLNVPPPPAYDSSLRVLIGLLVHNERTRAQGRLPLYVISTGNVVGRDAYYSWFPVLVDSLPDRVINVVSSDRARNLPWTPGTSSRIHIAAPGVDVGTWGATGGIYQTGTSFATPLVAGVAGLLFSFDSTLTAAEVKDLLIRGAHAGGDTAQGVPVLDAYESLRLAAQRPGAPLCGNRLWAVGDSVYARRGNTTERIVVVPTGVNRVIPFHGGRLLGIQSFNASTSPLFEWQNRVFTVTSRSPQSWESVTGTSQSIFAGRSHDGDTTLTVLSGDAALIVNQSPGGALASVPIPAGSSTTVMKCLRRDWDFAQNIYVCNDSTLIETVTEFHGTSRGAISPQDEVVATVTRMQRRLVEELPDEGCPNASATPPSFCPKFVFEQLPLHTTVRILRRSTGTVLYQWQVDGAALAPVTFSEDGSELGAQESRVNSRSTLQMIGLAGGFGWSVQTTLLGETVVSCRNAFYAPHVGSLTLLQPRIDNTAPNACIETLGNVTFGARIAGNSPPGSVRRTEPPTSARGKERKKGTPPTRR